MVEYMEEGILGTGSVELLYIIYDEYVYLLIEMGEIRNPVTHSRFLELGLEGMGTHIENYLFRMKFQNPETNGLGQMGLAQS